MARADVSPNGYNEIMSHRITSGGLIQAIDPTLVAVRDITCSSQMRLGSDLDFAHATGDAGLSLAGTRWLANPAWPRLQSPEHGQWHEDANDLTPSHDYLCLTALSVLHGA